MSATIPLVPADPSVREYQLFYPDLPSMLADAQAMAAEARFHRVILFIAPGPDGQQIFAISAARFFSPPASPSDHDLLGGLSHITDQTVIKDIPFLDFADRVRPPQSTFNPWLDPIVPASTAAQLTDSITGQLQQASRGIGTAIPLVVLAVLTSATLRQPLLRAPTEGDLFIIDSDEPWIVHWNGRTWKQVPSPIF